jgi:hypothetical protein
MHCSQPVRLYLRGSFLPLSGYVTDVTGPKVEITPVNGQPRSVMVSGPNATLLSAEVLS